MEFFEFFFSGPGWGWKVFALMCFISIFVELIPRIIKIILDYKTEKFKIKIEKHTTRNLKNGTPATKEDVR